MHRRWVFMAALAVLIVPLVVFAGCSSTTKTTPTTPKTTPKTTPSTTPSGTTGSSVSIVDFSFQPATLTVAEHTTVTWKNNGSTDHNITFDTFNSGMLPPGQSFSHTFDSSGSFAYHCSIHPAMVGTIMVTSGGGSNNSGSTSTTPTPQQTPSY